MKRPYNLEFRFLYITNIFIFRGRRSEAIKNLCKLRGFSDHNDAEVEISAMEVVIKQENVSPSFSFQEKCSKLLSRSVFFPIMLLVFLFFTQSFSGSNMVSYYTVTILQMAEIPLDENITAILVAAQYVLGYFISSILVTRIPRRALLVGSLILMMMANLGAGLVLLHKYDQQYNTRNNTNVDSHIAIIDADNIIAVEDTNSSPVDEKDHSIFSFIPVLSCILITFGYACGLGPVPFILFGELFPSK